MQKISLSTILNATYLKVKANFLLSGTDEAGQEIEVKLPLEAMSKILLAAESATLKGYIGPDAIPQSKLMTIRDFEVSPGEGGVMITLDVSGGARACLLLPSSRPKAEITVAADLIRAGLRKAGSVPN